ncbi:MAG: rhomboid family intramembrane serine protease [Candidatus Aenigmatarchaeota archaeon]
MADCSYCGKEADIPFKCKFCSDTFCSEHRLPENHECVGLDKYKEKARSDEKVVYEPFQATWEKKSSGLSSTFLKSITQSYSMLIISICFVVFLLQAAIPGFTEYLWLSPQLGEILSRPWTFITSIFLHGNGWHLFVNMLVLFFFGGELERRVGSRKFLEIFLVTGIAGNLGFTLFSYATGEFIPAVGASGAIFGVFATLAIIAPEIRVLIWFVFPLKIRQALVIFALWDLFLLPRGGPIANSAHLAGLAIGLIYGYRLKNKQTGTAFKKITRRL